MRSPIPFRHTEYTTKYRQVQALVSELKNNKQFNDVSMCTLFVVIVVVYVLCNVVLVLWIDSRCLSV